MITVEQAYYQDPVTGLFPNFEAYSQQQAGPSGFNASVGTTAGNPNLSLAQQYLGRYGDVQQDATQRVLAEGIAPGPEFQKRMEEIALEHFNAFGVADGRTGFGYTPPEPGTFTPGPNDDVMFGPNPVNTGGNSGGGMPGGGAPGFAQPTPFDFDQYNTAFESALGNFNGLLDSYNSFFGDMLDNAQDPSNMQPQYGGGFLPFATTLMPPGGGYQTSYNPFNTTMSSFGGGWNSGSSWGGGSQAPGQAANTSHQQWFTF